MTDTELLLLGLALLLVVVVLVNIVAILWASWLLRPRVRLPLKPPPLGTTERVNYFIELQGFAKEKIGEALAAKQRR